MEMSRSRLGENSNSFGNNNTNSFNNVFNVSFGNADETAEILEWLSPLDPRIRHQDIREHRVEDVGSWLLETEEYQNWFEGIHGGKPNNSTLFCYGDPGVGKTYISSLVIDTLGDWVRGQNIAVACFYFDFAAQKEQSPLRVLSSLIKQVVGGLEKVPAKIAQAYQDQKSVIGGRKLGLGEIVEMLQDISSTRPTFICIDALDECVAEYRVEFLDSLKQILHKSPNIRIFLAGRLQIHDEVEKHLVGMVVAVSVIPAKGDIVRFLQAELRKDVKPDAMDQSLEADIIKKIPGAVSEIFLLVSLNIKAILKETTLHRRRERLGAITDGSGLGGAYDTTIRRIKEQGGDGARLGMEALMWISHSERPLSVDEICHALAVEIGSTDMNTNNVPSIRIVIGCCQGLVAVDAGSSTIRLIHFTLKEYLSGHADLFDRSHSRIAETCLTYLNFKAIKGLSTSPSRDLRGTPFLEYSSLHWGIHMRMELSDRSRYLALDFLNQYDNHISAELLWESAKSQFSIGYINYIEPFSALHCVSYFGIAEAAIDLIRTKRWDVNQRDSAGLTPLMWAARYGREEVVKLLLQQKHTQPDIPDMRYDRTALSWAAEHGHEEVVRLFLGPQFVNPGSIGRRRGVPEVMGVLFGRKYVNPDRTDIYGRTPLLWAAKNGHDGVVKLLLVRKDVSPDGPDRESLLWDGGRHLYIHRTPLSLAAEKGHDGVAKLLLEREDVSPDKPDGSGRTPLSWAAQNGHDGVVKILLEREDVSPDRPSICGQTPLSWAAENGKDGVVKILLEREDVSPDKPDNSGQTPLSWAAEKGHDGVVKILLEREDVSPDKSDNYGQTPLSWAAEKRHDGVVKLLLEREDVSPNRPDNYGRTLLSLAAEKGRDGLVRLLLEREDVGPDEPDIYGRTPLLWAVLNNRGGAARLLLEREDVSPDRPDDHGVTPLSWAAREGYDGIVRLLLKREDVSPGRPNNGGQTPLLLAALCGHDGIVRLLLEREGVSPDRPDNSFGRTPLSWAAQNGHGGVVQLLLGRKGVSPDKPDNCGQTPLSFAAWSGNDVVVKILLEQGNINPDRPRNDGRTPLSCAAGSGHDGAVRLLLEREDVSPDRADNDGLTPLSWAARHGYGKTVKLLLEREDVSPDKLDNRGDTPLSWAAWNGQDGVVKQLLEREDVSPDRPDNGGRTPLSQAARNGREGVVKLLLGREDVNPDRPDNHGRTPLWYATNSSHHGVIKLLEARKPTTPIAA